MANWNEYKTSEQKVTWGVGLTLDGTGRFPLIAKRIWSTLADAQAWIDDTSTDSTATPGLTITVINDTDSSKNGVYFVKSIASDATETEAAKQGVLEKLGAASSAESVKEALDKLIAAVGVDAVSGLTEALKDTNYLSGDTTDSVVDALKELDDVLKNVAHDVAQNHEDIVKTTITAATFNGVAGSITTSGTGTSIALTADTSDVQVADDFVTTTYPTFSGATAIAKGDTVSNALNDIEKSISGLAQTEIDDKATLQAEIDAIEGGAGLAADGKYVSSSTANYISAATSLADADTKLDAKLKEVADQVTANKVASANKTVTITTSTTSTDLAVNIDSVSLSASTDGVIGTTLHVVKLTDDEVTALSDSSNVREAYKLVANNSTAIGDVVKIYKDSSVKSVEFTESGSTGEAGQFLKLTYILADGSESVVYVDMSKLISEKEFASGLTVTSAGVAIGVVDSSSEAFLTVGENGFKLSGVSAAISAAATVVENNTANTHVTVSESAATDGHKVYTVNESDIQSASAFNTYSAATNTEIGNIETAVGLAADGTHVASSGNYTSAASTIEGEIVALDAQVKTNTDNIAKNNIKAATVNGKDATFTTADSGTTVSVTIDGDDVQVDTYSAVTYPTALTAETVAKDDTLDTAINKVEKGVVAVATKAVANATEIDAIETGAGLNADGSYSAKTDANYIKDATSLVDADNKLDTALKDVADDVTKNKLIEVTVNSVSGTITTDTDGTKVAVSMDGDDLGVGADYATHTYDTAFSSATAVTTAETVSDAISTVEGTLVALSNEVIKNEQTDSAAINKIATAAGVIASDGTIAYTANTADTYISAATSLADADDKLDAAIKANADKLITAATISGTHIDSATSKVEINGQSMAITANVVIPDATAYEGTSAITIADKKDATNTKEVKLVIDPTEDDAVSLTQSASGLKATLKVNNTAVTETNGGVQLTNTTDGLSANVYWGTF